MPPKSAKLSQTQVDMQAREKTGIHTPLSMSASLQTMTKGTIGYARTPSVARAPAPRIFLETMPAVMAANTARKKVTSNARVSAFSQSSATVAAQ